MRCLNEPIASQANNEDEVTGRFWEGRFKSQALLDEQALAACMVYVDLNPIRAKIAATPETSDYTSLKHRILCLQKAVQLAGSSRPLELLPFVGNPLESMPDGLPFELRDYLELVDWSGRIVHPHKRGAIAKDLPLILQRLNISAEKWRAFMNQFAAKRSFMAGMKDSARGAINIFRIRRMPELPIPN